MKELLEKLYPINATLLGDGYDKRLDILKEQIPLDILEYPSGNEYSTWTIPDEWVVKDAWIKYNGKKIIDIKKNPHALALYSVPFQGKMTKEELLPYLYSNEDVKDATPHVFKFYENTWGFCLPFEKKEALKDGDYEVFIDSEFKKGIMKIGVHTIKGESQEEVLLFAHLDHPFQANDNLSGVVCLLETIKKLKTKYTIKLIFCPETIGSIAYAHTQDLTNVKFVIAVDICGNDENILLLKTFDPQNKLNRISHCALQIAGKPYRKGPFRATIGSDETVFNDPRINIPGICLTTHSDKWKEYHTDKDTPDKINYEKITEMSDLVCKIIEIAEKDYVPVRNFSGPLRRSKYDMQTFSKQMNLNYDYFFYSIDGKKSLAELCADFELNFDLMYEYLERISKDSKIGRAFAL